MDDVPENQTKPNQINYLTLFLVAKKKKKLKYEFTFQYFFFKLTAIINIHFLCQ